MVEWGVNYGLVLAAENEAELVSVSGHEMAHSIELHGTGREKSGALVGLATQFIEIGISEPGTKPGSNRIIGLGQKILTGQYSQLNDLEAALVGVDLMVRVGFYPRGTVGIKKISRDLTRMEILSYRNYSELTRSVVCVSPRSNQKLTVFQRLGSQ